MRIVLRQQLVCSTASFFLSSIRHATTDAPTSFASSARAVRHAQDPLGSALPMPLFPSNSAAPASGSSSSSSTARTATVAADLSSIRHDAMQQLDYTLRTCLAEAISAPVLLPDLVRMLPDDLLDDVVDRLDGGLKGYLSSQPRKYVLRQEATSSRIAVSLSPGDLLSTASQCRRAVSVLLRDADVQMTNGQITGFANLLRSVYEQIESHPSSHVTRGIPVEVVYTRLSPNDRRSLLLARPALIAVTKANASETLATDGGAILGLLAAAMGNIFSCSSNGSVELIGLTDSTSPFTLAAAKNANVKKHATNVVAPASPSTGRQFVAPAAPVAPSLAVAIALQAQEARTEAYVNTPATDVRTPPELLSLLETLRQVVPFSFFVSLQTLFSDPSIAQLIARSLTDAGRHADINSRLASELVDALSLVPSSVVDCRVFSSEVSNEAEVDPNACFLRLVAGTAAGPFYTPRLDLERGDETFAHVSPFPLAEELESHVRLYVQRTQEQGSADSDGWLTLDEVLNEALPEGMNLPLLGPASILVFERLPHLFDVDAERYLIRLRRMDSEPLDALTSPTPRVVRYLQQMFEGRHECVSLSTIVVNQEEPEPQVKVSDLRPAIRREWEQALNSSLAKFVALHPRMFLIQPNPATGEPSLWTPRLFANSKRQQDAKAVENSKKGSPSGTARSRSLQDLDLPPGNPLSWSDRDLALVIFQLLPETHFTLWGPWMREHLLHDGVFPIELKKRFSLRFFASFPDLFQVAEPMINQHNTFAVAKPHVGFPEGCYPLEVTLAGIRPGYPKLSLREVLRQVAIASVGGNTESMILQRMTASARVLTKESGGLERVLRQVPQWFDVRNTTAGNGQAVVTYIGGKSNKKSALE